MDWACSYPVPLNIALAMTRRAAGQQFLTSNPVFRLELLSLVAIDVIVLPLHVIDLRLWPDEILRLPVTRYTPLHLQRIHLVNSRHIVDLAVTGRAADALGNMDTMIEIGVFRQIVYAGPFYRLIVTKTRPDGFEIRAVGPDLSVAVHAGLGRRHPGRSRGLNRRMTISAIYTVIPRMVLMAKLHGLLFFDIYAGEVGRAGYLRIRIERRPGQYRNRHHADAGNIICTFIK